ncbi:NF-kappa-B inhibitor delta isoform X2 [Betta splendens]|uniref:NF-kappa-B inhibitor delta isoform X2 n=1 Tax=Betta splendens TaxID=158456 RepID=A0A6P7KTQ8_BETSP|nr:NF-kappa-B inhibitor delta isoform X2 [Betta splendens]
MHFDKSPKEKPCCTLPTVKKLLEEKRKRETSSLPPSCSAASTSPAPSNAVTQLASTEQYTCTGASSSYSDMALSYESWPADAGYNFFSQPGPTYSTGYSPLMVPEYNALQQLPGFGDAMSQGYDCQMTVGDPGMPSPWSLLQSPQLSFQPQMDSKKLAEARMLIAAMEQSSLTVQDEDGDTLLHIYTAKGFREHAYAAAEKLSQFRTLDVKEHKGKTPLLVAVAARQAEIAEDLLSLGADVNACDDKGQTALHLASHYGFPDVLQVILSYRPAFNLEARNFEGMTPLHCAAISHSVTVKASAAAGLADEGLQKMAENKLVCVDRLVKEGASLQSQEIKSNKTVLHLAVKEGNLDLVRYLLSISLPNMKDFVNMKAHGHTALHMAAGLHGNPHQEEILRLLLSKGADASVRNLENDQPAHLLQSGPQGEQLKLMLKKRNVSSRRRIMSLQDQE